MRKNTLMILGMVTVIFATFGLLAGCLPTSTGTGTDATTGSSSSFYIMIGFIVILFALMYFFTIRPQRKRQQNQARMITELQKGDKVVTIGGLYGTVESASEDSVVLRVESGTTMRFVKSAIATKVTQQPQTGPQ